MFDAVLTRDIITHECIFGTLVAKGEIYYTLERPWIENAHNISCIPKGAYTCLLTNWSHNGETESVYAVKDVPNRGGILIHPGNWVIDSHGCILLALGRDIEQRRLVSSRLGLARFITLMGVTFTLDIV